MTYRLKFIHPAGPHAFSYARIGEVHTIFVRFAAKSYKCTSINPQ